MEKITFECEVITPMFLAGADGQTPELRAPSIKGALRFWWRAMHGDLDIDILRKYEGVLFGDTQKRSKIIIRVLKQPEETKNNVELLPHKAISNHRSPKKCYPEGEVFIIKIMMPAEIKLTKDIFFTKEQMKKLFLVTSYLGGLGKRSRRGCGSFKIISIDDEKQKKSTTKQDITNLIDAINSNFSFTSNSNYPIIKSIEIGACPKNIHDIGLATHDEKITANSFKNRKGKDIYPQYEATIGSGRPRFASPIYISILSDSKPIITTLHTVSPTPRDVNLTIQTSLKNRIL
jgi:CRISPR-associated protein Cmr1